MARRKGSCRKPLEAQDGDDIRLLLFLTGCALRCQCRHTPDTCCAEKQDV
jgi:pyruvate-formate lyase-activating enzyme